MIIECIASILLISLSWCYYILWVKPKRILNMYGKLFRENGYHVLQTMYYPYKSELLDSIKKGTKLGDAMKTYKQSYSKYDIILTNIFTSPKILILHPDFIKDFYSVDKHYQYPKETLVTRIITRVAGNGLAFSEGREWKRKRAIFNKVFNFQFLKSLSEKIAVICEHSIHQMQQQGTKILEENAIIYSLPDLFVRMSSGVMLQGFLGGTENEKIQNMGAGKFTKKMLTDICKQSHYPPNMLLGPKFMSIGLTSSQREIEKIIKMYQEWGIQFIKKRMTEIEKILEKDKDKKVGYDIIEALMIAKRNAMVDGSKQEVITSEHEIFEQFTTFFFAGIDTTSNFLQMMIYQLARHPEVEQKVRVEIENYMKNEDYSFENLKNFTYIDMVQKQIIRTYCPALQIFSRRAMVDNYLNGIPISKGTVITIPFICNHYSQRYFMNPTQFRPERWQKQCDDINQFIFGGFGGGARTCIGKHLAMLESKIAVIKFLKRYKQIILPNNKFKMVVDFLYCPEEFKSKMIIK